MQLVRNYIITLLMVWKTISVNRKFIEQSQLEKPLSSTNSNLTWKNLNPIQVRISFAISASHPTRMAKAFLKGQARHLAYGCCLGVNSRQRTSKCPLQCPYQTQSFPIRQGLQSQVGFTHTRLKITLRKLQQNRFSKRICYLFPQFKLMTLEKF